MDRRSFITGAIPLVAATTVGATVLVQPQSEGEQIKHHADEIRRLLKDTAPSGMTNLVGDVFVTRGGIMSNAFPEGYKNGQQYAHFWNGAWELRT